MSQASRRRSFFSMSQTSRIIVDRWQKLVKVAKMAFAKLPGGVAHALERYRNGRGFRRKSNVRPSLPYGRQACSYWQFAGDEVRAASGAARLRVVVGGNHALRGETVEVRCLARHHATMVRADVEPAYIVSHDEDNIGFLERQLPLSRAAAGWQLRCAALPNANGRASAVVKRSFLNIADLFVARVFVDSDGRRIRSRNLGQGRMLCRLKMKFQKDQQPRIFGAGAARTPYR
jgi:hypothetical protein